MFCPPNTGFFFYDQDCWALKPKDITGPVDFYLFDGAHDSESQAKAITHFVDGMADEFILCVDDFGWVPVEKGTEDGLRDSGVTILAEYRLWDGNEGNNQEWWNGFGVFLLRK